MAPLPLSAEMRASCPPLSQAFGADGHQARRTGLLRRLLRQGEAGVGAGSIRALEGRPDRAPAEDRPRRSLMAEADLKIAAAILIPQGRPGRPGTLSHKPAL